MGLFGVATWPWPFANLGLGIEVQGGAGYDRLTTSAYGFVRVELLILGARVRRVRR